MALPLSNSFIAGCYQDGVRVYWGCKQGTEEHKERARMKRSSTVRFFAFFLMLAAGLVMTACSGGGGGGSNGGGNDNTVDLNRAPVLDPTGPKTVNEGEMLEFTITASDPDGDSLTYSASNLPAGASFDSVTRRFTWSPDYGQAGSYPDVIFTVADNGTPPQSAYESITITVNDEVLLLDQEAYIKASDTETGDYFGYSVSLSGDTLAVGAVNECSSATGIDGNQADNSASSSGAVYVFTRSGDTWVQQAYIKGSNTETWDYFGYSVSLSGDTLAVGAPQESSSATGIDGDQADNSAPESGAVYVLRW
jgi:hypothetical protein